MKKADIAMIILIASVSILVSYFVASNLFGNVSNETVKVKTIDSIDSVVQEPDAIIFGENAINPTYVQNVDATGTQ
jgi:hypothetical protein